MGFLHRIKKQNKNGWMINGSSADPLKVNLEYWDQKINLGDALAPVIFNWIMREKQIPVTAKTVKPYTHLLSTGSVLSMGNFDAVVWGSGILSIKASREVFEKAPERQLDIRAVRGPLTASVLTSAGYNVPDIYGDPGILMPLVYPKKEVRKLHKYCVIPHYTKFESCSVEGMHYVLDIRTSDYAAFIDALLECEYVISSSLHGIILAEAYGVPAVLLWEPELDLFKYYDYYQSTGRYSVIVATSVNDALKMSPMPLPNLYKMQELLVKAFPVDLFYTHES